MTSRAPASPFPSLADPYKNCRFNKAGERMLDILQNRKTIQEAVPFDKIKSEDFEAAIDEAMQRARTRIEKI